MQNLELGLFTITFVAMSLGCVATYWTVVSRCRTHMRWAQVLFIVAFLTLSLGIVTAACFRAHNLTPLGLCAGLLLVAGVWDIPAGESTQSVDKG